MGKERRQFDRAFKLEAVRLVMEEGRPVAAVARELGVNENSLHRWSEGLRTPAEKTQLADQRDHAFVGPET